MADRVKIPPAVMAAVDECVMGAHNLAAVLPKPHPPHTASAADGLAALGLGFDFDLWRAWRGIVRFREQWDAWAAEIDPPPTGSRPRTMEE